MLAKQLIVTVSCLVVCNGLSIGNVSDKKNVKREASVGDLFPDWVPFKNKHGEELGEFVQVTKAKPKKRLAPPVNFIMRAVAEPEGDEYFDKGQGGDNEDYFEKKEWSDQNRPAQPETDIKVNHTQISDIDGVVNIITKKPNNPVLQALNKAKKLAEKNAETSVENSEESKKIEEKVIEKKDKAEDSKPAESKKKETKKYEDEVDYEEGSAEKKQESAETEQSENEAKKASILDSVDELKERHAEEQRFISEKVKEEEIYKEERERDKIQAQLSQEEHENNLKKSKKTVPDYEEYEDKNISLENKYKISPEKIQTTTPPRIPKRTTKRKGKKDKTIETGKLSVFKNPQLYMVYDEESTEQSTTTKPIKIRGPKAKNRLRSDKFSSKYSDTTTDSDGSERISLLPQENDAKAGEPTLFFPKKRKNKKRKNKYTSLLADSSVAETIADNTAKHLAAVVNPVTIADVVAATSVTAADILSTNSDPVSDAVPASSDNKEKEKKEEDFHREKGGGKDYRSEHEDEHKEIGKKAYEGVHEETKSAKGHHDKENHLGQYDDHGGVDEFHHDEAGHYGVHHHEEHGKKHAKYEESGKHSKGHSTKGSHDVHKKEEYEKKIEFFEEEGDSGEEEKHGGYNHEHGHSEGGHFKKGNFKAGHEEHAKGESGDFSKGGHMHVHKGHKSAAGDDDHGKHGHSHFEEEGQDSGKKWVYHHGSPAKTANLIRIDRRAENYHHGPQYFG